MSIYHHPPPPFLGGGQPHAPRTLAPAITAVRVDNPPFSDGGPIALSASIVAINWPEWSAVAWPYRFISLSAQPYGQRQLSPGIPGQSVTNPPFSFGGPYALRIELVSIAQPDPWTYSFMGDRQPFAPKRLSPAIPGQSVANPPFTIGGPYALKALSVAIAQPDPWTFAFIGSAQPYGPKRRSSAIPGQSADPPPFTLGGPYALKLEAVAVNQPDWSYTAWPYVFMGNRQPYGPKRLSPAIPGQSADPPPFLARGRTVVLNSIVTLWQPDPWTYSWMGRTQPFAPATLSPAIPGQSADPPPFLARGRTAAAAAIRTAWDPPPPDYQLQLYVSRPIPQLFRPTARGYFIL